MTKGTLMGANLPATQSGKSTHYLTHMMMRTPPGKLVRHRPSKHAKAKQKTRAIKEKETK